MARDLYALLPNISWRGIPFPVEGLDNDLSHMHAEHYFVYKDGAHIEALGRNALIFQGRIPFHNGIIAGPGESWAGQTLYPDLSRRFLAACLDRSTGELMHPDFGAVKCKVRTCRWRYSAGAGRDGVTFDVAWHETSDNGDEINASVANQAPVAEAIAAADRLDNALAVASPPTNPIPELANDTTSFGSMMRDYQDGTGNLSPLKKKNEALGDALDRRDSVNDWPLRSSSEDLRAALFTLGANPNSTGQQNVQGHMTENPTTVPLLALKLGTTTVSLITLNPSLSTQSRVAPGTKVLYSGSI